MIKTSGRLTTITAQDATVGYTYNGALLTKTAWTGSVTGDVERAYDTDFRVTSLSVSGATPITFQYDADSLLTKAGDLTLTRSGQNGLVDGTGLGNVTDSYAYDDFGEVTTYEAKAKAASLLRFDYTYDKLGRITQKKESQGGTTHVFDYGYDPAGRLAEVKRDGTVTAGYGYDPNGNRTQLNGSQIAHYDAQDRLLDYQGATYQYSANGELQQKSSGNQVTKYSYDVLGNLKQVTLPNGTVIDYLIDGQNRRIGKKVGGTVTQAFLYQSQLRPIAELNGSGAVVSRFVYGTDANVPDYMLKGGVTYRIIKDHLGSPRLVVNVATNAVAQELEYDAFGAVTKDTSPGFQPFGFAGGLYDTDTKLVRFGARDYDPDTGRWTAKDPILFAGRDMNLYGYTLNDPVNLHDPFGLSASSIGQCLVKGLERGAVNALIGAAVLGVAALFLPEVAAVEVGLGLLEVASTAKSAWDVGEDLQHQNWNGLAYDVGSAIGGQAEKIGAKMPETIGENGEGWPDREPAIKGGVATMELASHKSCGC